MKAKEFYRVAVYLRLSRDDIATGSGTDLAGNKADLFDREQVNEDDAKAFAKEIKAIFKPTSAMTAIGIDDLFDAV